MFTICPVSIATAFTGLADRFALILGGLARAVAAHAPRLPVQRPGMRPLQPVLVLLWGWLNRRVARFAKLARRPVPPRARTDTRHPRVTISRPRLPDGSTWLLRLGHDVRAYRSQVEHFLADPELAALIEAAPQTARLLRPLCRLLDLPDPPPPATPATARPEAARHPSRPGLPMPLTPDGRPARPHRASCVEKAFRHG